MPRRHRPAALDAVAELAREGIAAALADPESLFAAGRVVKDSRTSKVAFVDRPEGAFVAKRFNAKGRFPGWRNVLRTSPALRSWYNGHALLDRGLPTPRPWLVVQRRAAGRADGYLLAECIADGVELQECVRATTHSALSDLIDAAGRLVRTMHERGVNHRDLKAANVLVSPAGCSLIDLVGVRVGSSVSRARRVQNLARLNASFLGEPRRHANEPSALPANVLELGLVRPRTMEGLVAERRGGDGPESATQPPQRPASPLTCASSSSVWPVETNCAGWVGPERAGQTGVGRVKFHPAARPPTEPPT